ncbi:hypothetical protein [Pseudomonas sp.]|uniref:hypothetical protein n=1 Tax=Pseudomonas sp. TaxID=306 RepID=UPI003D0A9341
MSWWWALAFLGGGFALGLFYGAILAGAGRADAERALSAATARITELERTVEYYRAVAEDARQQLNAVAKGADR